MVTFRKLYPGGVLVEVSSDRRGLQPIHGVNEIIEDENRVMFVTREARYAYSWRGDFDSYVAYDGADR